MLSYKSAMSTLLVWGTHYWSYQDINITKQTNKRKNQSQDCQHVTLYAIVAQLLCYTQLPSLDLSVVL